MQIHHIELLPIYDENKKIHHIEQIYLLLLIVYANYCKLNALGGINARDHV